MPSAASADATTTEEQEHAMKPTRSKPVCESLRLFLAGNLGRKSLAALTGTDVKALAAAVHIVQLYAYNGEDELLEALRIVVQRMQPTTQEFAFHSIAHLMEWESRAAIWQAAGMPIPRPLHRCRGEPISQVRPYERRG